MKPIEQTKWINDYLAGSTIKEIATRYTVPYWRVRNAIIWSDELAERTLHQYAHKIERLTALLTANPATRPEETGIDHGTFRKIRYALIVKGLIPNHTRYTRRITLQEETRIQHLASVGGDWRQLGKLRQTTGRKTGQQAYIARQILGQRILHYRQIAGYSMRHIAETVGIHSTMIQRLVEKQLLVLPFDDEQYRELLGRGLAMYEALNGSTPEYQPLVTYYRHEFRRKYITKKYICQITHANPNSITNTLKNNGIARELLLHDDARVTCYNRDLVARFIEKRWGRKLAVQLHEYDNDWLYLRCRWFTW